MNFANQAAFDDPTSRQLAMGVDLNPAKAFTDQNGNVLLYAQTGGMIGPQRHEIMPGSTLYRFASGGADPLAAMAGGWWIAAPEFERVQRFARVHAITDPMAARILCGVPPEWQDMGSLVRVRASRGLLAWRGLANTVVTPHPGGGPQVVMLHQNAIAERRLFQLYIPGLVAKLPSGRFVDSGLAKAAMIYENDWRFGKAEAMRGWLYLDA
nr:hypothetical protein [Polymorphobacter sp.]